MTGTDSHVFLCSLNSQYKSARVWESEGHYRIIFMKTAGFSKEQVSDRTSFCLPEMYIQPEVEVLAIQVEKGFSMSFASGDSEGSVSTGNDFGWDSEIEL